MIVLMSSFQKIQIGTIWRATNNEKLSFDIIVVLNDANDAEHHSVETIHS